MRLGPTGWPCVPVPACSSTSASAAYLLDHAGCYDVAAVLTLGTA